MRAADDFSKLNSTTVQSTLAGSPTTAFRFKTLLNLMIHLLFAGLFAFEHQHQLVLQNGEVISSENTPVGNVVAASQAETIVYTPVSNVVIMVLNVILATLSLQITCNIDSQIEHIQAPTFMPRKLYVKPSLRYRYMYWVLSFLVCLFILCKDHGETVVEHTLFVLTSLCLLFYAPFWMRNAVLQYEEAVQEDEINGIDRQALRALDRMSLGYISTRSRQKQAARAVAARQNHIRQRFDLEMTPGNQMALLDDQSLGRGSLAAASVRPEPDHHFRPRQNILTPRGANIAEWVGDRRISFDSHHAQRQANGPIGDQNPIFLTVQRPKFTGRFQTVVVPLVSPRYGQVVPAQNSEDLSGQFANLGALNSHKENVSHQLISRRNVGSLTFLEEEDSHPSYERNEDDAFVSSVQMQSAMPHSQTLPPNSSVHQGQSVPPSKKPADSI